MCSAVNWGYRKESRGNHSQEGSGLWQMMPMLLIKVWKEIRESRASPILLGEESMAEKLGQYWDRWAEVINVSRGSFAPSNTEVSFLEVSPRIRKGYLTHFFGMGMDMGAWQVDEAVQRYDNLRDISPYIFTLCSFPIEVAFLKEGEGLTFVPSTWWMVN